MMYAKNSSESNIDPSCASVVNRKYILLDMNFYNFNTLFFLLDNMDN